MPGASPLSTPRPVIVPAAVLELIHAPPAGVLPSVVVWPTQTVSAPVMVVGSGSMVTSVEMLHPANDV